MLLTNRILGNLLALSGKHSKTLMSRTLNQTRALACSVYSGAMSWKLVLQVRH